MQGFQNQLFLYKYSIIILLSFVKTLIELHKTEPAHYAEADFKILLRDYSFVYERTDGIKKFFIAINPSANSYDYYVDAFKKVILTQNVEKIYLKRSVL